MKRALLSRFLEKFNQALEKGHQTGVFQAIIDKYAQKYQ